MCIIKYWDNQHQRKECGAYKVVKQRNLTLSNELAIAVFLVRIRSSWHKNYKKVTEARKKFTAVSYRKRQWHPTPVLLPGKSHGRRSLVGCRLWGRTESDTTEAASLSLFTFMHWRRKWQPTPVFLPGESQGRGSLVGCRLWGCAGLDMTEVT